MMGTYLYADLETPRLGLLRIPVDQGEYVRIEAAISDAELRG